jgi:HEAT repeat protein
MRSLPGLLVLLAACGGRSADTRGDDPYSRYLGVRDLAGSRDAASVAEVVRLLDDPHYLVVTGALETLGDIGHKEFLQHVAPRARHEHPLTRSTACGVLARIGHDEGIAVLVETLKDAVPAVRRSALKALAAFGRRAETLKPLVDSVADKEPSVSLMAHDMLVLLTERQDVPRDRDAWARAVLP